MFCTNCGKKFSENSKFCGDCGTPRASAGVSSEPKTSSKSSSKSLKDCPSVKEVLDELPGGQYLCELDHWVFGRIDLEAKALGVFFENMEVREKSRFCIIFTEQKKIWIMNPFYDKKPLYVVRDKADIKGLKTFIKRETSNINKPRTEWIIYFFDDNRAPTNKLKEKERDQTCAISISQSDFKSSEELAHLQSEFDFLAKYWDIENTGQIVTNDTQFRSFMMFGMSREVD